MAKWGAERIIMEESGMRSGCTKILFDVPEAHRLGGHIWSVICPYTTLCPIFCVVQFIVNVFVFSIGFLFLYANSYCEVDCLSTTPEMLY